MEHETKNELITEGAAALSIDEIKQLRSQLPDNWKWAKCYEMAYINSRTGREFLKKHWALSPPDEKGLVCSLGLISHDNNSNKQDFFRDIPVQWVEKSLMIVDTLLHEIESLKSQSRGGGN